MSNNKTVTASFPFCADDERFSGAVEVVEIELGHERKTVGLRLRVRNRSVHLARHRTEEIIASVRSAAAEASTQYKKIIEEMNK